MAPQATDRPTFAGGTESFAALWGPWLWLPFPIPTNGRLGSSVTVCGASQAVRQPPTTSRFLGCYLVCLLVFPHAPIVLLRNLDTLPSLPRTMFQGGLLASDLQKRRLVKLRSGHFVLGGMMGGQGWQGIAGMVQRICAIRSTGSSKANCVQGGQFF